MHLLSIVDVHTLLTWLARQFESLHAVPAFLLEFLMREVDACWFRRAADHLVGLVADCLAGGSHEFSVAHDGEPHRLALVALDAQVEDAVFGLSLRFSTKLTFGVSLQEVAFLKFDVRCRCA